MCGAPAAARSNIHALGFFPTRPSLRGRCGWSWAIVETAKSAKEGLRLFDTWHPDMLVSDIGMPDVDGYDFIRTLRDDRHSRIPAVALTAMPRIDDRVKALTAGYQMHVSKPVEPVELISIVASLVGLVNRRPAEGPA